MLSGEEVLEAMEAVETTRQGIFVMPKERISILSTYVYSASSRRALPDKAAPPSHGLAVRGYLFLVAVGPFSPFLPHRHHPPSQVCLARVKALQEDLHATRQARLPGQ